MAIRLIEKVEITCDKCKKLIAKAAISRQIFDAIVKTTCIDCLGEED